LNILLLATSTSAHHLPSTPASKPAVASPVVKPEEPKSTPNPKVSEQKELSPTLDRQLPMPAVPKYDSTKQSGIDAIKDFIAKNNIDINTKLFGFSNNESPLVIRVDSFNGEGIYTGLTFLNNLKVHVSIESAPYSYTEDYGSSLFHVTGKVARRKAVVSFYGIVSQLDKESLWYLFLQSAASFDDTMFKTPDVSSRNLLSSYSQCINTCTDKNILDTKTCSATYLTCIGRAVSVSEKPKCANAYNTCTC
jgi:hypothetical protein